MDKNSQYKFIFFLSSVLVITTIIGEFSRIENIKEGMNPFALIPLILKLIICFFSFVFMILNIIFYFLQLAFIWFLPKFIPWAIEFIVCAFTKFVNIPNCFLWYGLEIAGKILYLPFRITFAVLDLIFISVGVKFSIKKTIDSVWLLLDDLDHMLYDSGIGFHFVHYPDDVIKRCYTCKIGKFPDLPKFNMKPINDFIKCIK